jgi:hypothetical protein
MTHAQLGNTAVSWMEQWHAAAGNAEFKPEFGLNMTLTWS